MLRCEARAFPVCTAYGYTISRPFFYSVENTHAYKSGPRGKRQRDVHCEFDYWPLAVNMPPTKVCPQFKAAVPVRWKTCECCDHVFRSKRKAECNLREKTMKRVRAVECEISLSCTRPAKERQKFMSKLCIGRNKTECAWQA